MRPTVAIVVGHRESAQGAVSIGGESEWVYNSRLASQIAAGVTGVNPRVVYRPDNANGYHMLPKLLNEMRPDAILSLHFNDAASSAAYGTEMLHATGSALGEQFARITAIEVQRALGTRLRHPQRGGTLPTTINARGGKLLHRTHAPCIIAEPAFGSNRGDWHKLDTRRDLLAVAYIRSIEQFARKYVEAEH